MGDAELKKEPNKGNILVLVGEGGGRSQNESQRPYPFSHLHHGGVELVLQALVLQTKSLRGNGGKRGACVSAYICVRRLGRAREIAAIADKVQGRKKKQSGASWLQRCAFLR